jgi:glycerol transport system ATP-binding protein
MARLDLENVRHAYGSDPTSDADYALRRVDHTFADGGAYALLGPSGCGKTSLLNIISGLVTPTEGRVLVNGEDVTGLPTEKRNIAQVFQFPVVYDSMTVRENLAFPLRNRRVKPADIRQRVDQVLEVVGLTALADRRARGLTADEKQKISLGRGLVRPDVSAILFDEPLTVVDPQMKWQLRASLRDVHRRSGATMIYVTHDQTEALTFADRVVVMHAGEIVQVGTPADLFEQPKHTFVGYFIGSPGMNVMPVTVEGANAHIDGHAVPLAAAAKVSGAARLELGVRPEFVKLSASGIPAQVVRVEDAGRYRVAHLVMAGHAIAAMLREGEDVPADPHVSFDPAGVHLYADSWRVALDGKAAP